MLEEAGGFSSDTLAEDQDLTIQVRKLGYKIGYEEDAIGLTEAPDTLRGLAKQRFRWSFGTLQCMWKHKDALLNPRYGTLGFIAMPNVWIFQVIFPLISPLMDLMFIWTLRVRAIIGYLEHQQEYAHTPTQFERGDVLLRAVPRGRLVRGLCGVPDGKDASKNACSAGCSSSVSATGR